MAGSNLNNPTAPSQLYQAVVNRVHNLAKGNAATATITGTALDLGTVFQGDAYLSAFIHGVTGSPTSVIVTVEESADNSTWTTLQTFTTLTAAQTDTEVFKVRLTKRYVRALVALTGGSTPTITGAVTLIR